MSELDRVRERVRQNRAAHARTLGIGAGDALTPEARLGSSFRTGDRVFDTVTGEEGVVIGGARETIIVATPERRND